MKLPRRQFLHLAVRAAVLPFAPHLARAQAYPSRPVRIVVGFAAGGGPDVVARLMGQSLSERLGQSFVVENQTDAVGNVATEAVVRAQPDGYTLLLVGLSNATNPALYDKLNFDFIRDIAPVASIRREPHVKAVHPSFPAKTIPEFIAHAKANPGTIDMASSGNATSPHLAGELFKAMTGVNIRHVPYRGGAPALNDLIAGRVQVSLPNLPGSIEAIRAAKVRVLAVTTAARSELLPDIPTVAESVPGYEVSGWYGIGAPKGTPAEIINVLNREINAVLAVQSMKARFAELGAMVLAGSPADFGKLIEHETDKWAKLIRDAKIRLN